MLYLAGDRSAWVTGVVLDVPPPKAPAPAPTPTPTPVATPGDTVPPQFGGIKSATTCIPGPVGGDRTTTYHLSWDAGSDDRTPSEQLVYDVYQADKAGGEDYSKPTYTSAPGATTIDTNPIRDDATPYFVVRARDASHARRLYDLGATDAVPETVEASLQLSEAVLVDIGVPMGLVIASIHERRDEYRRELNRPDALGDGRRRI